MIYKTSESRSDIRFSRVIYVYTYRTLTEISILPYLHVCRCTYVAVVENGVTNILYRVYVRCKDAHLYIYIRTSTVAPSARTRDVNNDPAGVVRARALRFEYRVVQRIELKAAGRGNVDRNVETFRPILHVHTIFIYMYILFYNCCWLLC